MTEDELLDERFTLAYRADYSARYHRRRSSFLSLIDTLSNIIAIVSGSSVFLTLTQGGPVLIAQIAGLVITTLAIMQVVIGFGPLGARHAEWMRAWDKLANDIRAKPNPTERDLRRWHDRRAEIEGECVSELRALGYDCENQTKSHMGIAQGHVKIGRLQRAFIQIGTFQGEFPEIANPVSPPSRENADPEPPSS
jgi:hypothetical protein